MSHFWDTSFYYLQRYLANHTKSNLLCISSDADSLIASSVSVRTLFRARRANNSSLDERPGDMGGDTVILASFDTLLAGTLAAKMRTQEWFSQSKNEAMPTCHHRTNRPVEFLPSSFGILT